MADEISTRTRRYLLGEDGILRVTIVPGAEETLADAQENVRVGASLTRGRKYPILDDSRRIKSCDREARAYYARPESTKDILVVAMLIGSPIQRAIGNFFLTLNKPAVPVRLFTSEAEAVAWLKSFVRPQQ